MILLWVKSGDNLLLPCWLLCLLFPLSEPSLFDIFIKICTWKQASAPKSCDYALTAPVSYVERKKKMGWELTAATFRVNHCDSSRCRVTLCMCARFYSQKLNYSQQMLPGRHYEANDSLLKLAVFPVPCMSSYTLTPSLVLTDYTNIKLSSNTSEIISLVDSFLIPYFRYQMCKCHLLPIIDRP